MKEVLGIKVQLRRKLKPGSIPTIFLQEAGVSFRNKYKLARKKRLATVTKLARKRASTVYVKLC